MDLFAIHGFKGLKGDTGSTGVKGEIGYQGLKGDKGDKGKASISEDGLYALAVYVNVADYKLALGLDGDPGSNGVKGDMGYQGFNGTNGERGQKGNQSNRMTPLVCYDVCLGDVIFQYPNSSHFYFSLGMIFDCCGTGKRKTLQSGKN